MVPGAVNPAENFYIAIKFTECLSHPVRVPPVGCGCDDTDCEYSRIRGGFELTCLGSLPDSHSRNSQVLNKLRYAVNGPIDALCPQCPDSPWIVLAKVAKGAGLDSPPRDYRRVLRSTAMMQELGLPR